MPNIKAPDVSPSGATRRSRC